MMPNNDLISRAAAIAEIEEYIQEYSELDENGYHNLKWCAMEEAKDVLSMLPNVDAAPVVHARWTTERTWKHDGEWYCSACEYEPVVFMDSAFCPNCGAHMDGERRADDGTI